MTKGKNGEKEGGCFATSELDDQYEDFIIEKVVERDDHFEVTDKGGWTFCPRKPLGFKTVVAPGMRMRLWTKGIGYTVRGCAIGENILYYRSEAEQRTKDERERDALKAEADKKYKKEKAGYNKRITLLHPALAARFSRFRKQPRFGPDLEDYELFCCEQAMVIFKAFPPKDGHSNIEAVKAWADMPVEKQREKVPGISSEHSGNTFGHSIRLAVRLMQNPKLATLEHGGMAVLVGCEAYGCIITPEEAADAGVKLKEQG